MDIPKRIVNYKLISVEHYELKGQRKVTLEFDDGTGQEPWRQSWVINPETPISLEMFLLSIKDEVARPIDVYSDLYASIGKSGELHI